MITGCFSWMTSWQFIRTARIINPNKQKQRHVAVLYFQGPRTSFVMPLLEGFAFFQYISIFLHALGTSPAPRSTVASTPLNPITELSTIYSLVILA